MKGEIVGVRLRVVLLAATIAVVAAGCGGGDSGDSTSASSSSEEGSGAPSRAVFIEQANEVCLEKREGTLEKVAAYQNAHRSDGLSRAALAKAAVRAALLSTIATEAAALQALQAPAGGEGEVEAILATLERELGEARREAHDNYDEVEDYFADSDREMREYGLVECQKQGQG